MKNFKLFFLLAFVFPAWTSAQQYLSNAENQILTNAEEFGLKPQDVQSIRLTDYHQSRQSGTHHHYFTQEKNGIMIYNAISGVHLLPSGELLKMDNGFYGKIDDKIDANAPAITAEQAVLSAAQQLGYTIIGNMTVVDQKGGAEQAITFRNPSLSKTDIQVRLMYQPLNEGSIKLAWDLHIQDANGTDWWSVRVDATTGEIIDQINWVVYCTHPDYDARDGSCTNTTHSHHRKNNQPYDHAYRAKKRSAAAMPPPPSAYRVYPLPNSESPHHGNRFLLNSPEVIEASPFGWHDTNGIDGAEFTTTRGNNVDAYETSSGFRPDGGASLTFDFPIDTNYSAGTQSEASSITNSFYLDNYNHDLWYQYGFDERSGNFQENNYNKGGMASDYVNVNVQNPSNTCNGSWGTPPDGQNPVHNVFICQDRDGAYDSGVMSHEYAHGVSSRLVAGPSNVGCLGNQEQMGEGWSDYFGLIVSIQPGDQGTDGRGRGTWNYVQGPNGPGNRPDRYSTDLGINNTSYDDIKTYSVPHGVGSVWCNMLWEMTWALIDVYGFNFQLEEHWSSGGNNLAAQLVMDGMKLTPCNPGFVDARDAILEADMALTGGENQCIIWTAFAKRGLGEFADQGSSGSRSDGTEDFTVPSTYRVDKTTTKETAAPGETLTYDLTVANNVSTCNLTINNMTVTDVLETGLSYVPGTASGSPSTTGSTMEWTNLFVPSGQVLAPLAFDVQVDPGYIVTTDYLVDDFEDDVYENFTTSASDWTFNSSQSFSGGASVFALDVDFTTFQTFTMDNVIMPTGNTVLSFHHFYDTENTWDGGLVQASNNGGASWDDLGKHMFKNGYNSTINGSDGDQAFSGNSGGFIETRIDLREYDGDSLLIRFVMSTDGSVSDVGWFIDLVRLDNNFIFNQATATETTNSYVVKTNLVGTRIEEPCNGLLVTSTGDSGFGTLRDVTACASSGDTIRFSPEINGDLIQLTSGQIVISGKTLTLVGNGSNETIIDGALDTLNRLFEIQSDADISFRNLTIQNGGGPTFAQFGGAILLSGNSNLNIVNCALMNNQTNNIFGGGALFLFSGTAKAINCTFDGNRSNSGRAGVASIQGNVTFDFTQCLFINSFANNLGACLVELDAQNIFNITNCTFTGNESSNDHSVIYHQSGATTNLYNNIFYGNNGAPVIQQSGATINAENNIVDIPGLLVVGSNGNVIADPLFVDASNGDYSVMNNSPAIDAGDNAFLPADSCDIDADGDLLEQIDIDLNGDTRIHGCRVDIGAYENSNSGRSLLVTNVNDAGIGSLRDVISCARSGDTIRFDAGTNGNTIKVLTDLRVFNKTLVFEGNGVNQTIVDGSMNADDQLFFSQFGGVFTLNDLTLQNQAGPFILMDNTTSIVSMNACELHGGIQGLGGGNIQMLAGLLNLNNCKIYDNQDFSKTISSGFASTIININQCEIFNNNSPFFISHFGGGTAVVNMRQSTIVHDTTVFNNIDSLNLINNVIHTNATAGKNNGTFGINQNNLINSLGDIPLGTTGNIEAYAEFADTSNADYSLMACSPGVNTGIDNGNLPAIDLAENSRVVAWGVDRGAFEYGGSPCTEGQCSDPIAIDCGILYEGTTAQGGNFLDGYTCTTDPETGPDIVHTIDVPIAGDITVTLTDLSEGGFEDLDVFLLNACNPDSCLAWGFTNFVTTVPAGTYLIVVDGYLESYGKYELLVDCPQGHVPCTEPFVAVNAPDDPMGLYHAIDTLSSNTVVTTTGVMYKAGQSVTLNPDFEVQAGVEFDASIEPCPTLDGGNTRQRDGKTNPKKVEPITDRADPRNGSRLK